MLIVTSYRNPDLDGVACVIAYTEYLSGMGKAAQAVYTGDLGLEVEFVKRFTKVFQIEKRDGNFGPNDQFILVDTSDPEAIDRSITPEKVVEIFDHKGGNRNSTSTFSSSFSSIVIK